MECAGERYAVLIGSEVTPVNRVRNFGSCRRTVRRRDIDDTRQRVRAIQHAIAASENLDVVHTRCRNVGEFKGPSDVIHGNAIHEHLVESRAGNTSAPDRDGGCTTASTTL